MPMSELTGNDRYARARCRSRSPKCSNRPEIRVRPARADVLHDVEAKGLLDPIAVRVLGALIDRERDSPHESNTSHGRSDSYTHIKPSAVIPNTTPPSNSATYLEKSP